MTDSAGYEESYVGRLRELVGDRRLVLAATRAVIRDREGRLLFVRRRDNGKWGMPAGAWELDETILECLRREVREETGLDAISVTPMAIYSYLSSVTAYGDPYQALVIQFLVTEWSGALTTKTDETTDAAFFGADEPPEELADHYQEVLADLQKYDRDGDFIVK